MGRRIYLTISISMCFLGCINQPASFSSNTVQQTEIDKEDISTELSQTNENPKEDHITLLGPYEVAYVIDGDTFAIKDADDVEWRVRMVGIDTPESTNKTTPELNCEEGRIAADYSEQLLSDKSVWLEYDVTVKDKYDRLLAYVYLDEFGSEMVQEDLLIRGLAICMPVLPNTRY